MLLYLLLTLLLNRTRFGVRTRAVIMNENLARGLGIQAERIRLATFGLGAGLGALAGALITPLSSVDPNMGLPWLVSAFMLVMVSGHSIARAAADLPGVRRLPGAGERVPQPDPGRRHDRRAGGADAAHPSAGLFP